VAPQAIDIHSRTGRVYVGNMVSGLAYVTHNNSNAVSRIDPQSHSYLDTISDFIGKDPKAIAINQQTGRVYVANAVDNTVSVLDR
jgi:DNA-binding beta-propeller fold protein YncE